MSVAYWYKVFRVPLFIGVFVSILCLYLFRGMGGLPSGQLVDTYMSPDNTKAINIHLCGGGATVSDSIRGELVLEGEFKRNIYWQYKQSKADVRWMDNNVVKIGDVLLDIRYEKYDWRRNP